MADIAYIATDAEVLKMERRIKKIYRQATADIEQKRKEMLADIQIRTDELQIKIKTSTGQEKAEARAEYKRLLRQSVLESERYQAFIEYYHERIQTANEAALAYCNGEMPKVYVMNYNQAGKAISKKVEGYSFTMVNEGTVRALIDNGKLILPKKKLDHAKDKPWNAKKLNTQLLLGIMEGESIPEITARFRECIGMNEVSAVRAARTMATSAQNKGRIDLYSAAERAGIQLKKQWKGTNDGREREAHIQLNNAVKPVNEPFEVDGDTIMYPGDFTAKAYLVYNCRCRLVEEITGYDSSIAGKAELQKAQDAYDDKKKEMDSAKKKTYSGIWKDDVTPADYASKLATGSIQKKKDYYNSQLASGTLTPQKMQEFQKFLHDLEDFEQDGMAYEVLRMELDKLHQNVVQLQRKFGIYDDPYSQARKDAALWAKTVKEADDVVRGPFGKIWKDAPYEERQSSYKYTYTYSPYNEPLRGIEYGTNRYLGVGNTSLNKGGAGQDINNMTALIEKSPLPADMWLQRGCRYGGMDKFFQTTQQLLQNGTQEELETALLGKEVVEYGFMSAGVAKGKGFSGNMILNIYAPKGTKAIYAEPFSQYGNGAQSANWDGVSPQSTFGSEAEMIFQQGTKLRVIKIERTPNMLYFDLEIIGTEEPQLWDGKH